MSDIVIVGGGLTAATAAKTLRGEGFDGGIRIFAGENHNPYLRPPLSKEYLQGKAGLDAVWVEKAEWYGENNVQLDTGTTVTAINPAGHEVEAGGAKVHYDQLLLATGCSPRHLPIPGADLDGVLTLRTLDDSDRLKEILTGGGKHVVLIGGGWIGLEIASSAKQLGNEVVVLERDPIPLGRVLGDELGTYFTQFQRGKGVDIRGSVNITGIVGENGKVTGVGIEGGETVAADVVLMGVGVVPNVSLAKDAGLDVQNGITTNAALATSAPDVFAAGDVAFSLHPALNEHIRSEHWANATGSGEVVAKSMLGQSVQHDMIPYFYTDQFDLGMEYSGYGPLTVGAEVAYRGDPKSGEFLAFWLKDGKVVAGMNVNVWDVNEAVQGIIRRGGVVDLGKLADKDVPLDEL
ncbi:MAG TPA: FAD-dependent oxidoreductase [Microbacteriaceae bacterium]|nr:FAD-dependent oxidoreductase [Microbacteriaceae bacterium]